MVRLMLSDEFWVKLRTIMLLHGVYDKPDLRRMVEGMLYRMEWAVLGETFQQNLEAGIQFIKNSTNSERDKRFFRTGLPSLLTPWN